jgi:hypothetical protein
MQLLRKIIREEIERIYLEMVERPDRHFEKQSYERLKSPNTDFPGQYTSFAEEVERNITFLRNLDVTFKGKVDIFMQAPKVYTHVDPITGKRSSGNIIWFFTSNNELDSLVFSDKNRVSGLATLTIDIDKLKSYVAQKGEMVLDSNDLKKLTAKPTEVKPEKPKQNIVLIGQTPYVVDPENNIIFKKNNPKVNYNVWELLDGKVKELEIDDKVKDSILSYLV